MSINEPLRSTFTPNRRQFIGAGAMSAGAVLSSGNLFAETTADAFAMGHAEVDTTPPLGIELAGFHKPVGQERVITGIRQPTAARALVLRVKDQWVALVSLDIAGVSASFAKQVQQRVAEQTGIPSSNVRVCATHTHSMPAFFFLRQWGAIPEDYQRETLEKVVTAVRLAKEDLSSAALYVGESQVEGGNFNRTSSTWKTDKEFTAESSDTQRWLDTTLHVLRFERANKPDVLWYHFSCHPVCYGDGEAGPDWVGLVAKAVREKHGVTPGYLQGHAGDVNPGDGKIWIGKAEPTAAAITKGIDQAIAACQRVAVPELRTVTEQFEVPLDIELLKQQLQQYRENPEQCNRGEWVDARFAKSWFEAAENWSLEKKSHATPVSALRLGELGMLFHSSELYSYYGLQIRRDSPFEKTIVVGYTDDLIGYLTDPRAYQAGEYAAITVPRIVNLPPFTRSAASELPRLADSLWQRTT